MFILLISLKRKKRYLFSIWGIVYRHRMFHNWVHLLLCASTAREVQDIQFGWTVCFCSLSCKEVIMTVLLCVWMGYCCLLFSLLFSAWKPLCVSIWLLEWSWMESGCCFCRHWGFLRVGGRLDFLVLAFWVWLGHDRWETPLWKSQL